jgi:LPXTG-site transpeptidase (sortase) family protein
MAKQKDEETVIPLGVVLMVVGVIVLGTAVTLYLLLPKSHPQTVEAIQAASVPTAVPTNIALLPETPLEENADNIVNLEEVAQTYIKGQPERIVIPEINLDAPVSGIGLVRVQNGEETYYQWAVPDEFRAGWHNTSAPLGKAGNTVLNGHHNINGEVFRDLINLEEGAEIVIYDRERPFTYTVSLVELLPERDQPLEVRVENAKWIAPTEDERITLVTCWPYADNSHRVVVVAYPTDTGAVETLAGGRSGN